MSPFADVSPELANIIISNAAITIQLFVDDDGGLGWDESGSSGNQPMQVLRNAQDIAGTIKRHQLTGPTWLIAEGGYGAETMADQLKHLGITTMTARPNRGIVTDATGVLASEDTPQSNAQAIQRLNIFYGHMDNAFIDYPLLCFPDTIPVNHHGLKPGACKVVRRLG